MERVAIAQYGNLRAAGFWGRSWGRSWAAGFNSWGRSSISSSAHFSFTGIKIYTITSIRKGYFSFRVLKSFFVGIFKSFR
jgi:hypothetical protein